MEMALPLAARACLALTVVLAGCREKSTPATADPAAKEAPAKTSSVVPAPAPSGLERVVVTKRRVEIPRAGHDSVVLDLPVVEGVKDVVIADKITAALAPEKLIGESLDDIRDEAKAVKAGDPGLGVQNGGYEVTYDDHGVLQIDAFSEFWGAYPSGNEVRVLLDLKTGDPITGSTAFRAEKIPALVTRLDAMLKAEVKASAAIKDPDFSDLVRDAKFEATDLDGMGVSDKGVTFHHEYAFPHVALALQPAGDYFVAWSDLRDDLDPKGPLARIHPVP
jgi:hypothetical protein